MRTILALSVLFGIGGQAVAVDEWRQKSLIYVEIVDHPDVPVLVENRGTTPTVLNPATGNVSRTRYIVGAAQQNPPTWHAKFTPLQQNGVTQTWAHGYVPVLPGWGFTVRVWWVESRGKQVFELYQSGQPTDLTIDRQRWWNDPLEPIEYIHYPLDAPPGGRLPPGGDA